MIEQGSAHLSDDHRKTGNGEPPAANYGGWSSDPESIILGVDTEYTPGTHSNLAISYQYCGIAHDGKTWGFVTTVEDGYRLSLPRLISDAIATGIAEGAIISRPKKVWLVGHFNRADMSMFDGFSRLKHLVDVVRGTYVTATRPIKQRCWDSSRHSFDVSMYLRDTLLLAPGAQKDLAHLGMLLNLPKITIEPERKAHLDKLLQTDPDRFYEYAFRDAEIAAHYAARFATFSHELLGEEGVPLTLASIGIKLLHKVWRQEQLSPGRVLGSCETKAVAFDKKSRRARRFKKSVGHPKVDAMKSLAIRAYHGGRAECFAHGPMKVGSWSDFDLSSAYPTAMSLIGLPDWDGLRQTTDITEFGPTTLGVAHVSFKFPDAVRFPTLPVATEYGLVFPREGEAFATAAEIYVARKLNAEVKINLGVVVPCDFSIRPFESFVRVCVESRSREEKQSFMAAAWKELTNSLYGKLAQGLIPKTVFNSRSGRSEKLSDSLITNPYFAAFTTGYVRALLGEILNALAETCLVCSVSTDGFLSNASEAEVSSASCGPLAQIFAAGRARIAGSSNVLEVKHRIIQPLAMRSRGQATLVAGDDGDIVLAKAGLKVPGATKSEQNWRVLSMFISRTARSRYEFTTFVSAREMHSRSCDLLVRREQRSFTLDYDFKREPIGPCECKLSGIALVRFDTRPWETAKQFLRTRESYEAFRKSGRLVKTVEDLTAFNEFASLPRTPGLKRAGAVASVATAKRMFLRALVRGEWGLSTQGSSYQEIAAWLSNAGYPTTKRDLENAARVSSRLIPGCVMQSPLVDGFLKVVQSRFPQFDSNALIQAGVTVTSGLPPPATPQFPAAEPAPAGGTAVNPG